MMTNYECVPHADRLVLAKTNQRKKWGENRRKISLVSGESALQLRWYYSTVSIELPFCALSRSPLHKIFGSTQLKLTKTQTEELRPYLLISPFDYSSFTLTYRKNNKNSIVSFFRYKLDVKLTRDQQNRNQNTNEDFPSYPSRNYLWHVSLAHEPVPGSSAGWPWCGPFSFWSSAEFDFHVRPPTSRPWCEVLQSVRLLCKIKDKSPIMKLQIKKKLFQILNLGLPNLFRVCVCFFYSLVSVRWIKWEDINVMCHCSTYRGICHTAKKRAIPTSSFSKTIPRPHTYLDAKMVLAFVSLIMWQK